MGGVVSPDANPAIGPGGDTLRTLGAKDSKLMQEGQVWYEVLSTKHQIHFFIPSFIYFVIYLFISSVIQ